VKHTEVLPAQLEQCEHALVQALSREQVVRDAPMSKRTTFGIGGPADLWVVAHDAVQVSAVLQQAHAHQLPLFVLGGGSNLLVADAGIRGVVLSLGGTLTALRVEDDGGRIVCGAGVTYPRLTHTALQLGWKSAAGWIGTPGQVGGALMMNAGSREGEISDVVTSVEVASIDGTRNVPREDCGFSYRSSCFQTQMQTNLETSSTVKDVLTSTILQCDNRESMVVGLQSHADALLKRRHATQPKLRSAGSIFKNPAGDFAGRLIEACGLKGMAIGGAQISEVHANFVVNTGGALARDVVALATHAQQQVQQRFDVSLIWEVKRVGDFDAVVGS
jgi:UDP-N-acetylmuramate dehydrogenase